MKSTKYFPVIFLLIFILSSCSGSENKPTLSDTATHSSGVDSMPIATPDITDSGAVKITPPITDSNVVKPDSNKYK